jgi:hypothetical protein
MITVRFRGDDHTITLPYCEVANGDMTGVSDDAVMVRIVDKETAKQEDVKMSYSDFIKVVEDTFDLKEIMYLSVQMAGSYEHTKIL